MTIFVALFILSLGASAGAAIMGILTGGKVADLEAENAELRDAAALDLTLATLKAIIEDDEGDEAA
jgi:hypothetical protein